MRDHPFWGINAPLSALSGGALVVMASCRLSFAIVVTGALIWVYVLSALASRPLSPFFPGRGKSLVLLFLSSFIGSVYLLLLWFLSPLLGMQVFFTIVLVPLIFTGSGINGRADPGDLPEAAARAFSGAFALGIVIIALSLIREPLGYLSLSLPGGAGGFVELFSFEEGNFFPVRVVSSSAGALILLGYGVGIFRRVNPDRTGGEQ